MFTLNLNWSNFTLKRDAAEARRPSTLRLCNMKSPQEKKRLSYSKDRRNTYGENSKSSRKNIPLTKALSIRSERHAQDRLLAVALIASEQDQLTSIENKVRGTKPRHWKKSPDEPLGAVLSKRTRGKVKNDA
jgi:hypothetical protein